METTRNKIAESPKLKGNWDTLLSNLKKHFALLPDVEHKFTSPQKNELLSTIEARLNRNREEVTNISK